MQLVITGSVWLANNYDKHWQLNEAEEMNSANYQPTNCKHESVNFIYDGEENAIKIVFAFINQLSAK